MMVTVIRDRSDEDEDEEKDKDKEACHNYIFMMFGGRKRSARNNQNEKDNK